MKDPRFFPPEGVCERTCGDQREVAKNDTLSQTLAAENRYREELTRDCMAQPGCVAAPHTESGRLAIKRAIQEQEDKQAIDKAITIDLANGGIL